MSEGKNLSEWLDSCFSEQSKQLPQIRAMYSSNGLDIKMTCEAMPEQYDVFKDGKQVAYLRLRHGEFRVDAPDCGKETIYETEPNGDGIFDADERLKYMELAMQAILNTSPQNEGI